MSTLLKWAFGASGDVPIVSSNVFNQQVYTGDGAATKTITTGVDLSDSSSRWVWNTSLVNGNNNPKYNTYTTTDSLRFDAFSGSQPTTIASSFSTTGYVTTRNTTGLNYLSLCFKRSPKFFDRFTYTGDGTGSRVIAHSLGEVPGIIFIKSRVIGGNWEVWHTGWGTGVSMNLPTGGPNSVRIFNVTSTTFVVNGAGTNGTEVVYDAYLLANDTSLTSLVKCAAYTGNGTTQSINLGWKPQFLLIKRNSGNAWQVFVGSTGVTINLGSANDATTTSAVTLTSTGFTVSGSDQEYNASGGLFAYTAIKE